MLLAPLLQGWVNQCRAWLQNKRGAGILQPYRTLRKLFHKDAVLAHNASPLFRATPYVAVRLHGAGRGDRADARRPTCRSRPPPT